MNEKQRYHRRKYIIIDVDGFRGSGCNSYDLFGVGLLRATSNRSDFRMNKGVFELTWKILYIIIGCLMVGVVIILFVTGFGQKLVDGILQFDIWKIWGSQR